MPELVALATDASSLENAVLRDRLAAAEAERCGAEARVAELEEQLHEAINRCVALERLHGTLDHAEVLRAIQDVIVNLVGSEELAIYELSHASGELVPVQSFGVAPSRLTRVPLGQGPVGRAAVEERPWIVGDEVSPGDPDLTACVPLLAEGRVVAVVAVWRLLPHKGALRDADRRMLRLLVHHGGNAWALTHRTAAHVRAA